MCSLQNWDITEISGCALVLPVAKVVDETLLRAARDELLVISCLSRGARHELLVMSCSS